MARMTLEQMFRATGFPAAGPELALDACGCVLVQCRSEGRTIQDAAVSGQSKPPPA